MGVVNAPKQDTTGVIWRLFAAEKVRKIMRFHGFVASTHTLNAAMSRTL
jgi:hypothetical protein